MRMTGETKFFLGIIVATLAIIILGVWWTSKPAPSISKEQLIVAGAATKGFEASPDYLVEFSDFQCPACKLFKPQVDEILNKYSDRMLFVYRHFPLMQHPYGQKAAMASIAAQNQGKFWEMYDYLFANQEKLSDEVVLTGAAEMGLDVEKFKADWESDDTKNKVQKDTADGASLGVNSTPTFYLNGVKLNLANLNSLSQEVEKAVNSAN